ncbi:hypothetical protein ACH9L7_11825 [Haloferax sp. S1W]|uniref:hypothetical protein n=1 Tax=Haloferax sp. S1W TaxID=3377110 RepID=UPI0037C760C6
MDDNNSLTRRSVLGKIGAASGTVGMLSSVGVQNVIAKKGNETNSRKIVSSPEIEHIEEHLQQYTPGNSPVNYKHNKATSRRVSFEKKNDDLVATEIPTRVGSLAHIQYGDFSRSLFFVEPNALGADVPVDKRMGQAQGGTKKNTAGEKGGTIWIEGRKDHAITFRTANNAELTKVRETTGLENIQAFTHSETDNLLVFEQQEFAEKATKSSIATSQKDSSGTAVGDEKVTVYKASTQNGDSITHEFTSIEVDKSAEINKGGFADSAKGGVSTADSGGDWCSNKKEYCAVSGYACLQELAICSLCVSTCGISVVAWPAVAVCLACYLLTCGTSALPQVGSCVAALDCIREAVNDGLYDLPSWMDFPDWYTNPAGVDLC